MANAPQKRVLIVEDEFLVSMLLEEILADMGYCLVTCIARLDKAVEFVEHADIDFAILDVNLGGQQSFPVAEILRRRGVAFIFATGYGAAALPASFAANSFCKSHMSPTRLDGRSVSFRRGETDSWP